MLQDLQNKKKVEQDGQAAEFLKFKTASPGPLDPSQNHHSQTSTVSDPPTTPVVPIGSSKDSTIPKELPLPPSSLEVRNSMILALLHTMNQKLDNILKMETGGMKNSKPINNPGPTTNNKQDGAVGDNSDVPVTVVIDTGQPPMVHVSRPLVSSQGQSNPSHQVISPQPRNVGRSSTSVMGRGVPESVKGVTIHTIVSHANAVDTIPAARTSMASAASASNLEHTPAVQTAWIQSSRRSC